MTDRRTVDTINDDQLSQLYDDLEHAEAELQQHAENESADAAAGSYAQRAERVEAQLTAVADLIADHEGDEWAAHPATGTLRVILDDQAPAASCSPSTPETEPNNPRTTVDNPPTSSDPHVYLSTGCYHGDHAYCQAMTGLNGAKRPASCKFCHAACQCPCHQQTGPPVHIGGGANAENCPACKGTNPDYPFICPGPDAEQPARTTAKNPAGA